MAIIRASTIFLFCLVVILVLSSLVEVYAWSNGGYSADKAHPDYGTHDWVAQHALDYLPINEKEYLTNNLAIYLYGTELPDNSKPSDGIGDTSKHHIYYDLNEQLIDSSAALRAKQMYDQALTFLKAKNYGGAAKTAGIISHYISDLTVFGHVMGSSTPWGSEKHHSDYENYVNTRTSGYSSSFNSYLTFDGSLANISAYTAATSLAYDTTFDADGDLTCSWMDNNYNWANPVFLGRCGESLNLAVNYVADVLHTLYVDSGLTPTPTLSPNPTGSAIPSQSPITTSPSPEIPEMSLLALVIILTIATSIAVRSKKRQ